MLSSVPTMVEDQPLQAASSSYSTSRALIVAEQLSTLQQLYSLAN